MPTPGPYTASDCRVESPHLSVAVAICFAKEDAAHIVHCLNSTPDLLEAAKKVAEMAVSWEPLTPGDITELRAAIAKAEGGHPADGGE